MESVRKYIKFLEEKIFGKVKSSDIKLHQMTEEELKEYKNKLYHKGRRKNKNEG